MVPSPSLAHPNHDTPCLVVLMSPSRVAEQDQSSGGSSDTGRDHGSSVVEWPLSRAQLQVLAVFRRSGRERIAVYRDLKPRPQSRTIMLLVSLGLLRHVQGVGGAAEYALTDEGCTVLLWWDTLDIDKGDPVPPVPMDHLTQDEVRDAQQPAGPAAEKL